jgi:hypothetical protein
MTPSGGLSMPGLGREIRPEIAEIPPRSELPR